MGPTATRDPLRGAIVAVAALGVGAVAVASAVAGARPALGVLAGAVLATANLWAFARLGRGLLATARQGIPWGALAAAKVLVLFAAVIFLLKHDVVEAIPLAIGYLVLPLGIVASQLTPSSGTEGQT
jgi:hypothetical protein